MPTRPLPNNLSLEHLRKEAKRLHKAVRDGNADALARAKEFHPRATGAGAPSLAQLSVLEQALPSLTPARFGHLQPVCPWRTDLRSIGRRHRT
jgi:hypothetical protein